MGLDLLKRIQYENPICKDNPKMFEEVYGQWVALKQSVNTYLFNRSGDQHVNEVRTT